MMRHSVMSGAVAAMIVGLGGTSATAAETMAKSALSTPEFVRMAAQSDEFEIQEGKLAEKAGTPEVRRFGELMVRDHTKTTEGLHAALHKAGMPVPPPPALTVEQKAMVEKLQGLNGKAIDTAYIEQAVASHRKALALHEAYDKDGQSAPLVAASREATPIVRRHLTIAERMAAGKPGEM